MQSRHRRPSNYYVAISRRTLDLEDYIDIARRHVGWIVGPTIGGIVVSIVVAFALPNVYISQAEMQITPAQISESIVKTTINQQLTERIMQMQQEILSRTSLSTYHPGSAARSLQVGARQGADRRCDRNDAKPGHQNPDRYAAGGRTAARFGVFDFVLVPGPPQSAADGAGPDDEISGFQSDDAGHPAETGQQLRARPVGRGQSQTRPVE